MKAIIYTKYGSPNELIYTEVEKPQPKDHEVLINVHVASINSWDWDLLRGTPFLVRIGGITKPKYTILGADIAGRVEAVGKAVKQFAPGDEVFGDISGCSWGGFAEYVCASETAVSLKPATISFEDAAAIPQAAVLALQGLRGRGLIRKGKKVLINGAGGGVGTFAIQLSKLFGAEVTAVDRAVKLPKLEALGADYVMDYKKEDFTTSGNKYDLILDVVGNRSIFDCKRALSLDGQYVMVGGTLSRIFQVMLLGPLISLLSKKKMGLLMHKPNATDQNELMSFWEIGKLTPVIDRHYPLGEVADALTYFGEGQHIGKVMIHIT
ncbi:NAD(P)-dependent alcohol dehydrogenase [Paenibacillus qinlingensis]|uniref:NAD(P)-dependent alcohol dehydrogenase n=1 Tax=Paenibacillus qinlingensis TaxID=1837343 RepID=UPI001565F17C|nr:NAD(P)-dependent alcohol dehydrogenase [Paenibacillus qinlingensis]NQX58234.1 NAD(P)-dependent alcohol dehydrogenase [Paenibacillus qinlingensis]